MIKPQEATRSQDAVDVVEDELQRVERDPVRENVHRVNDVQSVVPEGEAGANGHKERDHAALRDEIVERPVQVQCGGDDSHVVLAHAHGEGACATSDVETNAQATGL